MNFPMNGFDGQVAAGLACQQLAGAVAGFPCWVDTAAYRQGDGFFGHHLEGLTASYIAELMTQTQQVEGGHHLHVLGECYGTAGCHWGFAVERVFQQVLRQQPYQRVAAVQFVQVEGQCLCLFAVVFQDAFILQAKCQCFRQVAGDENSGSTVASLFQRGPQSHTGTFQKALHILLGAQCLLLFLPFG